MWPAAIPYVAVLVGLYWLNSVWWAMGLYQLGAVVLLLSTGPRGEGILLIRGWNLRWAAAFGVVGALSGLAIFFLYPWAGKTGLHLADELARSGVDAGAWPLFAIIYTLVTPFLEEWLWRYRLDDGSKAPSLTDVLFAGYHVLVLVLFLKWGWVLFAFANLTIIAWVWRWIRRKFGGLAVPIFSHLVADLSIVMAVWILIR